MRVRSPSLAIDISILTVDLYCVYDDEYHNKEILSEQTPRRCYTVLISLNIIIGHSISIYIENVVSPVCQSFVNLCPCPLHR